MPSTVIEGDPEDNPLTLRAALLYYDYTLTFADEKKLIWGRKLGLTTLLYVLCRYALVANVIYLLAISHKIEEVRHRPNRLMNMN